MGRHCRADTAATTRIMRFHLNASAALMKRVAQRLVRGLVEYQAIYERYGMTLEDKMTATTGGIGAVSAWLFAENETSLVLGSHRAAGIAKQRHGVSVSRFAALTMLDLLHGIETERTRLQMLRQAPVRFPPEPLRSLTVRMARKGLAHEDKTGDRALFLRAPDAFGVGFES